MQWSSSTNEQVGRRWEMDVHVPGGSCATIAEPLDKTFRKTGSQLDTQVDTQLDNKI